MKGEPSGINLRVDKTDWQKPWNPPSTKADLKTEPLFEIIDNQKINSMDLKLKNKTALVTGSTSGIGYAIAKSLAEEGAKVLINGRSATEVDRAIKKLRSGTGNQNIGRAIADFTKV